MCFVKIQRIIYPPIYGAYVSYKMQRAQFVGKNSRIRKGLRTLAAYQKCGKKFHRSAIKEEESNAIEIRFDLENQGKTLSTRVPDYI